MAGESLRFLYETPSHVRITQRVRTLTEFRTMSITPYPVQCKRDGKWSTIQTDELLPGDVVSIGKCIFVALNRLDLTSQTVRQQTETAIPADILLIKGTCIVNEAMLSGESTPLLKESIELLEGHESLDVDGAHKNAVLFSGTKVLQSGSGGGFKSCNRTAHL